MVVELRPLGVKCNIQCQYCYQNPQRDAGNVLHQYDFDAMMAAVEREGVEFSLFGGEPLLLPLHQLERLWTWGLARSGSNSLQTNGTLIADAHIELFRRYKVSVGISLDGPGDLNDARWGGTAERTHELTAKVEAVIERLCREGTPPRLIVTLHRGNATREKLPTMLSWFKTLERLGVRSVRIHLLEVDHADVRTAYALTPDENRAAIEAFADLERELAALRFDLFEDMRLMLLGKDDSTTCVWNACDPYTTRAVRGVEGNGQRSNCGRTNKEGIDFVKAGVEGFERYLALYQTPQKNGGCKGCRFFLMCKGQCPGTGMDNDWRNRSEHCEVWKWAYARFEEELTKSGEKPLSLSSLREPLEAHFLKVWAAGKNTIMARALRDLPSPPTVPLLVAHGPAPHPACPFQDRLDFILPPFTRVSWVSDAARDVSGTAPGTSSGGRAGNGLAVGRRRGAAVRDPHGPGRAGSTSGPCPLALRRFGGGLAGDQTCQGRREGGGGAASRSRCPDAGPGERRRPTHRSTSRAAGVLSGIAPSRMGGRRTGRRDLAHGCGERRDSAATGSCKSPGRLSRTRFGGGLGSNPSFTSPAGSTAGRRWRSPSASPPLPALRGSGRSSGGWRRSSLGRSSGPRCTASPRFEPQS